jgi:hypothetical protein
MADASAPGPSTTTAASNGASSPIPGLHVRLLNSGTFVYTDVMFCNRLLFSVSAMNKDDLVSLLKAITGLVEAAELKDKIKKRRAFLPLSEFDGVDVGE